VLANRLNIYKKMRKAIDFIKEGNEGCDFRLIIDNLDESDIIDCMIEFAKMHVEEALKQAYVKAESRYYHSPERYVLCPIEEESILTAYSLDGIV